MFHAFKVTQRLTDTFLTDTRKVSGDTCRHGIKEVMRTRQCQLFLLHIEGNRFCKVYLMILYVSSISFFLALGKRIVMPVYAVLMQLLLNDRVIIPEDEGIIRRLVLEDTELGIHVILHLMVVSIQMVGRDVHQHGDIGMEIIHVIQLEAA